MMKKYLIPVILLLAVLLPATAQNNPYALDDECYSFFVACERTAGTAEFADNAALLLSTARAKKDTKAECLYHIEVLKDAARRVPPRAMSTEAQDRNILNLLENAKDAADRFGYQQYFYYAYELVQNHFYNHGKPVRTLELAREAQTYATQRKDEYGLWMSYRYLVSLYISESDYISAKPYILKAVDLYYGSIDPTLRRQSLTRLYCDLADTYMVGSDSLAINIQKAVDAAQTHLDTLRCEYYLAKITAHAGDVQAYRRHRDYCLRDPELSTINRISPQFFEILDAIVERHFSLDMIDDDSFAYVREIKFIANIAEKYNYKDEAFEIEKMLVRRYEQLFASTNNTKVGEFDSRLGNTLLHAELDSKQERLDRITRRISIGSTLVLVILLVLLLFYSHSLVRNNRKLRKANQQVMLANAAKTRFVQNMSHEVRTPLNAIVGFSQLLSMPDGTFPEEEKQEFSNHIVNNSKMLTMLLDDILNASDMDTGKYRISYETGELHTMCKAAITSTEHRLQPGVRMFYTPESDQPFEFVTDPRRVQQILINLLTNACKHTSSGTIELRSSLTSEPGFVTFSVTDSGTGIPPEQAEHIFERFTKLDEFVQGTGLGLSICRDIAGRMGARVLLDTDFKGPGARFLFVVPVTPSQETNKTA